MPAQTPSPMQGMPAQMPDLPPGPSLENVRGPIEAPGMEPWLLITLIAAATLLCALLLWFLIAYIRRKRAQKPQVAPHLLAGSQLKQAQALQEDRDYAAAHSAALRTYLNSVLDFDILGQTTQELSEQITIKLPVNGHDVRGFLDNCDRIKFASAKLSDAERIQLSDTAYNLIESVESYRLRSQESGGTTK